MNAADSATAGEVSRDEATLAKTGDLPLTLTPQADAGVPYMYTLEGDVEDVSRQHIANRASLLVHPAPWYIGLRRSSYFLQQKQGLNTEVVAVAPDGKVVAGRDGHGDADADPVDERPPRRGQRVLHLGHRAQGSAGGIVDGHDRRGARAARPRRCPTAATSSSKRRRATRTSDSR